jgi:homoserine kinase
MFTVRVPATIANMGPGFDSFGMAVGLYNRFTFAEAAQDTLLFSQAGEADMSSLAHEAAADNIVFGAINRLYVHAGQKRPSLHITVEADIPVARGMGSSSTAIVAGLVAANEMMGRHYEPRELLALAIEMEGHPDNVAPALLGGVVLYDTQPYALPWPIEWRVMTLSPSYPLLTEVARRVLPREVPMSDAIFNLRKASVLTYALLRDDPDALRESLHDRLHQPYRRQMIKEYELIEKTAMEDGAFGVIISGSGSTMAVFYPTVIHAFLLDKLESLIKSNGWDIVIHDVAVDTDGATVLSSPVEI